MNQIAKIANIVRKVKSWKKANSSATNQAEISAPHKQCSGAGKSNTSITGAVTLLSLLFTALMGICGFNVNNTYADTISLSIDTSSIVMDLAPRTANGEFAKSSNANISVSTTSTSGYTLSIAPSTNSTNLTNGSNTISSITSAISESDFKNSSNTQYNNKWGYKPSSYYNTSSEQNVSNTNYRPLPGTAGEIIAKTTSANSSSDSYTISIGARANNTTATGSYTSTPFVITAVTNFVGLTITYNANGGYFGSSTSNTTNDVVYNATSETSTSTVTKYSHTPNITDDGTVTNGSTYAASLNLTDTVTIDGATSLDVTIYYDAESASYDWVSVYQTPFTISDSNDATVSTTTGNLSGKLTGRNSGRTTSYSTWYTKTYTVSGDTVKFHFKSDTSQQYYGYYAIITSTGPTTTYSKTAVSGTYAVPNNSDSDLLFAGWTLNQDGSGTVYADESAVSTGLPYVNANLAVTLYAKWEANTVDVTVNFSGSGVSSVTLSSSSGGGGTVSTSGGTVALKRGVSYTLTSTYSTNYEFSSYATAANGTLGSTSSASTTYTVTGASTLTVTGKKKTYTVTVNFAGSGVKSVIFYDRYGSASDMYKTVTTSGSTVSLTAGTSYKLGSTYNSGYSFSSYAKTSGTLGSTSAITTTYTATGNATLTVTGASCSGTSSISGTMQSASTTSSYCDGASGSMTDSRDNQTYTVAKIGGKLWMTRNLAIGCAGSGSTYSSTISSKSLISSDSNVSSTWSTPTATFNSSNNTDGNSGYTTAAMQCNVTYGGYYNYVATTAGTISGKTNSTNATYDICPKGWRLPTYSEAQNVSVYISIFAPVYNGEYHNGTLYNTGNYGYWWTSGYSTSTTSFFLSYGNSYLVATSGVSRYYGCQIRCIRSS